MDTQINTDESKAAVELARFYLAHAKTVYSEQTEPENIKHAKYLWRRLNGLNGLEITKTKLYIATKNYRKGSFNLDASLTELGRRGYIRIETVRKGDADKPTTMIFVNEIAKTQSI